MSKQKTIIATIDTETATLWGEVFDFGMVIHDKKGNVLARYDAIVEEVFNNVKTMKKAHYFNKVDTFYKPNIRCGRMDVKSWAVICKEVNTLMKIHNVNVVSAYNLAFDKKVIIATGRKYGGFMAINSRKELCLWRVSCETLLQQKTFRKLALKQGWYKKDTKNILTNAEVAYRYGMGEWEFCESHTALDDALIEMQLLVKLFSLKKKVNYGIKYNCWMLVNDKETKQLVLDFEKELREICEETENNA